MCIAYYRERYCVNPGITSRAQLSYGGSEQDVLENLQYHLSYLKNKTLLFDLMFLLQSTEVMLWGKGSR
jgi:lipopolysaccharide/colanic/teichoic acid biosynthesis glycosyltransferase